MSLEAKYEKLQNHVKSLESRIKELLQTIDEKNKDLSEKEQQAVILEQNWRSKIDELNRVIQGVNQEKEEIRHKLIRLRLRMKGEGDKSVEGMLTRLSREVSRMSNEMTFMNSKHSETIQENQKITKEMRDKGKLIEKLENELKKRTHEYSALTKTFEDFLRHRTKGLNYEKMLVKKEKEYLDSSSFEFEESQRFRQKELAEVDKGYT
jgi:chromosome segregation ATPase